MILCNGQGAEGAGVWRCWSAAITAAAAFDTGIPPLATAAIRPSRWYSATHPLRVSTGYRGPSSPKAECWGTKGPGSPTACPDDAAAAEAVTTNGGTTVAAACVAAPRDPRGRGRGTCPPVEGPRGGTGPADGMAGCCSVVSGGIGSSSGAEDRSGRLERGCEATLGAPLGGMLTPWCAGRF